jgi:hypothetical protein
MERRSAFILGLLVVVACATGCTNGNAAVSTQTVTAVTPAVTAVVQVPTLTQTATATSVPLATTVPPNPTRESTPSPTPSPTMSVTSTPTSTASPTATPTAGGTATNSPLPTPTSSIVASVTAPPASPTASPVAVQAVLQAGTQSGVVFDIGTELPDGQLTAQAPPLIVHWVRRLGPRTIAVGLEAPLDEAPGLVSVRITSGNAAASIDVRVEPAMLIGPGYGSPDDVAIGPDGTIYFSDLGNQGLNAILSDGQRHVLATGIRTPEGVAVEHDGNLIVVEQERNALLRFDRATSRLAQIVSFPNTTGNEGIDGVSIDPKTGDILVADSPNGRLLRVSPDGKKVTELAGHFLRPTSVIIDAVGNLIVADENGGRVYRVFPNGQIISIGGSFKTPDDVVLDHSGNVLVNNLGDGTIKLIRPDVAPAITLLNGLSNPHGIEVDSADNVIVVDYGHNQLLRLVRSFWLPYPTVGIPQGGLTLKPGAPQSVDLALTRATAYTSPVTWSVSGVPAGVTATLELNTTTPELVVLHLTATGPVASGAVSVRAESGGLRSEVKVALQGPSSARGSHSSDAA